MNKTSLNNKIKDFSQKHPWLLFFSFALLLHLGVYSFWPGNGIGGGELSMPARVISLVNLDVAVPVQVQKIKEEVDDKKIDIGEKNKQQQKIQKSKPVGGGSNFLPIFMADTMPRPLVDIAGLLNYPTVAADAKVEGTVVLELDIDISGFVVNVRIRRKAGWGFDEEAVRVIRKIRFKPAMKDKIPVAVTVILPIVFKK